MSRFARAATDAPLAVKPSMRRQLADFTQVRRFLTIGYVSSLSPPFPGPN